MHPQQPLHQQAQHHNPPPPPYNLNNPNIVAISDDSEDDSDVDSEESPQQENLTITISAPKLIRGNNNLLGNDPNNSQIPITALSRCLETLQHICTEDGPVSSSSLSSSTAMTPPHATKTKRHPAAVHIVINCGTTVIGDRNVLAGGMVGLKPRQLQTSNDGIPKREGGVKLTSQRRQMEMEGENGGVVAGAKRKYRENDEEEAEQGEGEEVEMCEAERGWHNGAVKAVKVEAS